MRLRQLFQINYWIKTWIEYEAEDFFIDICIDDNFDDFLYGCHYNLFQKT